MLDWVFEGAANWVASVMTELMDAVSGLFLEALGTDMTAMEEYFPFAVSAYTVIRYMAWSILFLIVVWQMFRAFGGPLTEAESPLQLLARGALFAVLIGYAKDIFSLLLEIARAPYTALMDTPMGAESFTFAGLSENLSNGLTTVLSIISVVGVLLLIIMTIALGWNYFKLLLETVERYVMVGILCYTSPLAFSMGGSKATLRVFQSWCRMVGSQLLLLVLDVWFLRAFNSSVGHYIVNSGALTTGKGSIFLWTFCALALLKAAQKFDSHLAALGLNVAQTGSSMGMEMLMAARVLTGFSKGSCGSSTAASFGGSRVGGNAAGGGAKGFLTGFADRYKPNSFVRDAVVEGGSRMGTGGGLGLVGRAFGGMAARNGATLNAGSISSVANRSAKSSGAIGGDIADRSLPNYMPHLANGQLQGMRYSDTHITGGHIDTVATNANGQQSKVELFSAGQYDKPETPHTLVQAADGSQWYQVASGDGMGDFYATPGFTGNVSESGQVAEAFPNAPRDTMLRTVDDGVLEASYADGSNAMWYSSAHFEEPEAPHEVIEDADGLSWYAMSPHAAVPYFEGEGGGVNDLHLDGGGFVQTASGEIPGQPAFGSGGEFDPGSAQSMYGYDGSGTPGKMGSNGQSGSDAGGDMGASDQIPLGVVSSTGLPADDGQDGYSPMPFGAQVSGGFAPPADGAAAEGGISPVPGTFGGGGEAVSSFADSSPAMGHTLPGGESGGFAPSSSGAGGAPAPSPASAYSAEAAAAYNLAQFQQFMPGFDQKVVSVDSSRSSDGILEVRHEDGSGTAFYDQTMYKPPKGDYHVFQDANGSQWYALPGKAAVERKPVYQDGKPVYDKDTLQTVNVETVRYQGAPSRFPAAPAKRKRRDRKPPKRKQS